MNDELSMRHNKWAGPIIRTPWSGTFFSPSSLSIGVEMSSVHKFNTRTMTSNWRGKKAKTHADILYPHITIFITNSILGPLNLNSKVLVTLYYASEFMGEIWLLCTMFTWNWRNDNNTCDCIIVLILHRVAWHFRWKGCYYCHGFTEIKTASFR